MTWFPVQAALKMSTLPGAIRATLDHLLDHINAWKDPSTGVPDPTQPQTLIAFESLAQLAADTGFSAVSVADHLKRLRGDKPLRKGVKLVVLELVEEATHHRAARYRLRPEALDRLADHERVKAFEQREHKPTHPYQLWLDWRAATGIPPASDPAEAGEGISSLYPEEVTDNAQGISRLYAEEGQGISRLSPRVQAAYTELTLVVDPIHQLTPFLPDPSPDPEPPPEKKVSSGSQSRGKGRTPRPVETFAPKDIPITPELEAWRDENAPGLDLRRAIRKFLHYAKAHHARNANWTEGFCYWVMHGQDLRAAQAQAQQAAQEQQRAADEARMRAFMVAKQAEEDALFPGGRDAWARVEGIFGDHTVCRMRHQLTAPCPPGGAQGAPVAAD